MKTGRGVSGEEVVIERRGGPGRDGQMGALIELVYMRACIKVYVYITDACVWKIYAYVYMYACIRIYVCVCEFARMLVWDVFDLLLVSGCALCVRGRRRERVQVLRFYRNP
jgi:hypothetical protein